MGNWDFHCYLATAAGGTGFSATATGLCSSPMSELGTTEALAKKHRPKTAVLDPSRILREDGERLLQELAAQSPMLQCEKFGRQDMRLRSANKLSQPSPVASFETIDYVLYESEGIRPGLPSAGQTGEPSG